MTGHPDPSTTRPTRRRFLKASAAAGAAAVAFPLIVPSRAFGANERLGVAGIGAGGKGEVDVNGAAGAGGYIVALCDVDQERAAATVGRFPDAKRYRDYREMLDKEAGNVDAVLVSTPDHHHAPAALRAMRMGKHVYLQKPICHTVYEARVLAQVARDKKLATQMGNQGHSDEGLRRNVELIRAGVLGKVSAVHVWTDRPIWPQGIAQRPPPEPVPESLDWDLWLGPAPVRPYSSAYVPFKWRGFWDFGTGALGDMGCHCMDLPFWALNLRDPASVVAESEGATEESAPNWSIIRYEFPANDQHGGVLFTWYDGGKKPPAELVRLKDAAELPGNGVIVVGDKDTLYVPGYWGPGSLVQSGKKTGDFPDVPETLPRIRDVPFDQNHYVEWVNACKGGPPALSNVVDFAGPMCESMLLGNVAIRAGNGKKLQWDAKAMKFPNAPEADRFVSKEYRKGWELGLAAT